MAKKSKGPGSIEDLKPAAYNPRKISAEALAGLDASMRRFGDLSGITFNTRTGNLIGGHQRVKALRDRGAQLVDGALQVEGGDRFPVRVVSWARGKEKAANVAANNPHIGGEFEGLELVLPEIKLDLGEEVFAELRFDALATEAQINLSPVDPDLGDGSITEKPEMVKLTAFVPHEHAKHIRSELKKMVEACGGALVGS